MLALLLVTDRHVDYWIAAAVMLVGAGVNGAIVEVVVMRRFRKSPRLVATVATIGLAQVLAVIEIAMPTLVSGRTLAPPEFPTPFRHLRFELGGVIFDGDHIAILVVAVAMVAGLAGFLRLSRYGIAVRAAAENADRAALLGIPVRRLSTLVWVVAAVCSAIAVFMRAPVTGLSPGASVSPTLLLYGLAAKSLVIVEDDLEGTASRYRLLETIRDFAALELARAEETAPARDAHLSFFSDIVRKLVDKHE